MGDTDPSRHLGLDLGATNIKWAVVERIGEAWICLDRGQSPTGRSDGADAIIARMVSLARDARSRWPEVESIGLGVPGLFDAGTGITNFLPNLSPEWEQRRVGGPMTDALNLPVSLINDARAFGLAELRLGAGRGCATMVGLTLGSGVGGVVVVGGQVHFGHRGTGGEAGHQTLLPDGPACTCGNHGCLEALTRADAVATACGTATAEEAVRAARAGDRRALDGITEIGRWLGIGIANLVVVLTPDRVVLGGGMSGAGELLLDPIRSEVRARVRVTDLEAVEIVIAELGTWAGAIGAAVHGAEVSTAAAVMS